MIWLLLIFSILITLYAVIITYSYIRCARVIFALEDQLPEVLEATNDSKDRVEEVLGKQHYFDSQEDVKLYNNLLDSIKVVRMNIIILITKFTGWSKQKYLPVEVTIPHKKILENDFGDIDIPFQPEQEKNYVEFIRKNVNRSFDK